MVNLRQGRVTKNVFMRDSHAYGVAISFAHTVNVTLVWSQITSGYALVVRPS